MAKASGPAASPTQGHTRLGLRVQGRMSMRQGPADPTDWTGSSEPAPSEDDIRVRAYHRYLERGASDGADFDDWLEAEKESEGRA